MLIELWTEPVEPVKPVLQTTWIESIFGPELIHINCEVVFIYALYYSGIEHVMICNQEHTHIHVHKRARAHPSPHTHAYTHADTQHASVTSCFYTGADLNPREMRVFT